MHLHKETNREKWKKHLKSFQEICLHYNIKQYIRNTLYLHIFVCVHLFYFISAALIYPFKFFMSFHFFVACLLSAYIFGGKNSLDFFFN